MSSLQLCPAFSTRAVFNLKTRGGAEFTMSIWNADHEAVAHQCECDLDEVEFAENEEGDEVILVRGEIVGKLERF